VHIYIVAQKATESYPPCLEYLRPRAPILLRLRRYSLEVMYLLRYLIWTAFCGFL